jgi:hypothetical protein
MTLDLASATFLDDVYQTLFNQLKAAKLPDGVEFKSAMRVVLPPDAIVPDEQPALIFVQGPIEASQKAVYGVTKWLLTAEVFVFFRADGATPLDQSVVPVQTSNGIIWALIQTLATPDGRYQTLGGAVYHCWVEGMIRGEVVDPQVILNIPIHILV